jgi:hypothetical protein
MRAIRPRYEPDLDDDPTIMRDRIFAELRVVADLAQRISDRVNRAAVRLATLPVAADQADDDQADDDQRTG